MADNKKYLDLKGLDYYNGIITSLLSDMRKEYKGMIWEGTTAQYNAAVAAGLIKEGTTIHLTDSDTTQDIGSVDKTSIQALFT